MIKMISVKEAARQWNITERRVAELCRSGRIKGAMRQGRNWQIPADALKPADKKNTLWLLPEKSEIVLSASANRCVRFPAGTGGILLC